MPVRYEIDSGKRIVRTWVSGVVTHEELEANRLRMLCDPEFSPDLVQLADCRGATQSTLSSDQIRHMAGHSHFSRTSRRAIVVRDLPASYGVGRMFEIHRDVAGGEEVRIFKSVEEAEAWLEARPV